MITEQEKDVALDLLRRGEVTMAEIAERLGRSRSTILRWAKRAGIDPTAARAEHVRKRWYQTVKKQRSRITGQTADPHLSD